MNKIILNIILIISVLSVAGANDISGLSYFRYTLLDEETSGFSIDRVYLTVKKNISDKVSFKFQSDVQNTDDNNAFSMYIKNAMMSYKILSNTKVVIGMQGMNMFNVQEKTWGNRFIEKHAMDLNKWSASADLGLGINQKLGNLALSLLYTNGDGYKKISDNSGEKLSTQIVYGSRRLDKEDGFNVGAVFSTVGPFNSDKGIVYGMFGGFSGYRLRVGLDFNIGKNLGLDEYGDSSTLLSAYTSYDPIDRLSVYFRYDLLDKGIVGTDKDTYILSGLIYELTKGLDIALDYKLKSSNTSIINMMFQLKF